MRYACFSHISFLQTFDIPSLYLSISEAFAWYAFGGRYSGVVVSIGEGTCHVVTIYENFVIPHGVKKAVFGAGDLTNYLKTLLSKSGIEIQSRDALNDIKEKMCSVPLSLEDSEREPVKSYTMPGGETISLGKERFLCGEALFNPALLGLETLGLHEMVYSVVQSTDVDMRKDLWSNVFLCGGGTMMSGLQDRLHFEIGNFGGPWTKKVHATRNRERAVWDGAAMLACCGVEGVSKEEYDEEGPAIVQKKCYQTALPGK